MMPAGTYVICDLCYVMHGEWEEVCSIIIQGNDVLDGEFTLKDGRRFAIYSTAYGDGEYRTNLNSMYSLGVDSGSIGCIRVEDVDLDNPQNNLELGIIVEFDSSFGTSGYTESRRDWDGVIKFGHVEVYTGYEEEEEYDNYYDEEEEEY